MVRGVIRAAVLCSSVAVFGGLALHFNLAQAHGPGSCDGHCQDQGSAGFASPNPSPYPQQQPSQQPSYAAPSAYYGQGLRTFANLAERDCPICRAEREQGPPASANNFAAGPNSYGPSTNFDASLDRPRLSPRGLPPRQAGYPMMEPASRGMRSPQRRPQLPSGMPIPVEPMPAGSERGLPLGGWTAPPATVADGMALVLQNDSPLMSGNEQLGSIDRDQTLRVLDVRGNWVQLETNWLGKNTWIRRNQVRLNDHPQPPQDIAPPAT